MSVRFGKVDFKNTNSIPVTLTVEAPIGTRVSGPQQVAANSSATINPGVENCLSVRLIVDDGAHDVEKQTFALTRPDTGQGRYAYLECVAVEYTIGDFQGSIQSHTG